MNSTELSGEASLGQGGATLSDAEELGEDEALDFGCSLRPSRWNAALEVVRRAPFAANLPMGIDATEGWLSTF